MLSRAREKGLDADGLRALGEPSTTCRSSWRPGCSSSSTSTILDSQGATDYADLIRRAAIEAEAHRDELRARFTPRVRRRVPGHRPRSGRAAARARRRRPQPGRGRRPAPVDLRVPRRRRARHPRLPGRVPDRATARPPRSWRCAAPAGSGRGCCVRRRPGRRPAAAAGRIDAEAREAFLVAGGACPGRRATAGSRSLTFDTERAEAEHLADLLRRAHLEDGIAWDEMAVLVRSGRTRSRRCAARWRGRRAGRGGADEVPLVRDPAVLPLLDALRAVVNLDNDDPEHVDYIDAGRAEALLLSPLGGLDAGDVRRLGRALRAREKARADGRDGRRARPASWSGAPCVEDGFLDGLDGPEVERARRAWPRCCPTRARTLADGAARRGGALDAVVAAPAGRERLRRAVERRGGGPPRPPRPGLGRARCSRRAPGPRSSATTPGSRDFLATLVAQEIPADTLAERGVRGAAVRLLTAHRSKGLEWRLVVVAHVQQEGWPDLRRRVDPAPGRPDRRRRRASLPPVTARELLLEERRLFYVACTRARQRLVVTAVASPDDEGEQPSRFLDELGVDRRAPCRAGRRGRCRWPAWSPSCAAPSPTPTSRLRCGRPPPAGWLGWRRGASTAAAGAAGRPGELVGHPRRSRVRSRRCATPTQPVPISASVLESVAGLPDAVVPRARGRRGRARPPVGQLGQLVHALAERVAAASSTGRRSTTLMAQVDAVWDRLEFRTPWSQRARARAGSARRWPGSSHWHTPPTRAAARHRAARSRRSSSCPTASRSCSPATPTGSSSTPTAGWWSVDLKTGRTAPSGQVGREPTSSSRSTSTPSTAAPSTSSPAGRARAAAPSWSSSASTTTPRRVVQAQPAHARRRARARRPARRCSARTARCCAPRTFPAVAGEHCRDCAFVADLPDQERRVGDRPVTSHAPTRASVDTPEDLQRLMRRRLPPERRSSGRRSPRRSRRPW